MKLASYGVDGKPYFRRRGRRWRGHLSRRLKGNIPHSAPRAGTRARWTKCAQAVRGAKPDHKLSDVRFLPVITNPKKILCVGINYKSHAAESGHDAPALPNIFTRFTDTLAAHEGEMVKPKASNNFDFEGELALIIGKPGRAIKRRGRAEPHRRLYLLLRRQRPRLHQILAGREQRISRAPARSVPGW